MVIGVALSWQWGLSEGEESTPDVFNYVCQNLNPTNLINEAITMACLDASTNID